MSPAAYKALAFYDRNALNDALDVLLARENGDPVESGDVPSETTPEERSMDEEAARLEALDDEDED